MQSRFLFFLEFIEESVDCNWLGIHLLDHVHDFGFVQLVHNSFYALALGLVHGLHDRGLLNLLDINSIFRALFMIYTRCLDTFINFWGPFNFRRCLNFPGIPVRLLGHLLYLNWQYIQFQIGRRCLEWLIYGKSDILVREIHGRENVVFCLPFSHGVRDRLLVGDTRWGAKEGASCRITGHDISTSSDVWKCHV